MVRRGRCLWEEVKGSLKKLPLYKSLEVAGCVLSCVRFEEVLMHGLYFLGIKEGEGWMEIS